MQHRIYTLEARWLRTLLLPCAGGFILSAAFASWLFTMSRHQSHSASVASLVGAGVCSIVALSFLAVCMTTLVSWLGARRKMHPSPSLDYPGELVRAKTLFFSLPQEDRMHRSAGCLRAVHEKLKTEGIEVELVCLSIGTGDCIEAVLRCRGHILSSIGTDNLEFLAERSTKTTNMSASIAEFVGDGWDIKGPWTSHGEAMLAWLQAEQLATQTQRVAEPVSPPRRL